jgi:ABC-type multidrug transport system permease subunit
LSAEDRIMVCLLSSLLMAAIGGCWWPLEVAPDFMKQLALVVPNGWALAALHQLISFGAGIDAVVVPLLVLFAFGLAANLAAARFFRA